MNDPRNIDRARTHAISSAAPALAIEASSVRAGCWRDSPFPHVTFPEHALLSKTDIDRLVASFPRHLMTGSRRAVGSDKTYDVNSLTLYDEGRWMPSVGLLDESWRWFARSVVESDYRYALASVLRIDPGPIELELRVTEFISGGWMSRHTDREEKLFTQNIYLCPNWHSEWGGGLALYADRDAQDPIAVVVPRAGSSVAFARSERSWHSVLPVSPAARESRKTLLLHAYRPGANRAYDR